MRKLAFFLTIAGAVLMMGCSEDPMTNPDPTAVLKGAKKPLPQLVGTTQEFFSPATSPYLYVGTIDFSEYDGYGIYNIAYNITEFPSGNGNGQTFTEDFYIYEGDIMNGPNILMTGTNSGVIVKAEKFITNGEVGMAFGDFEGWEGRRVHVRGEVISALPDGGPALELTSTFRIN